MAIKVRPDSNNEVIIPLKTSHFSLSEFFVHCTSYERKVALSDFQVMENIFDLAQILAEVREQLRIHKLKDIPIRINSGYRSISRNKLVGGSATSQHLNGSAVDITCEYNDILFDFLRLQYDFGQLIRYDSFIHFSLPSKTNHFHVIDKRTK